MSSKIGSGIKVGVLAGIFFGVMMQVMTAPTPEGTTAPMMAMVAKVVGSSSLIVVWIYHLFNSADLGD